MECCQHRMLNRVSLPARPASSLMRSTLAPREPEGLHCRRHFNHQQDQTTHHKNVVPFFPLVHCPAGTTVCVRCRHGRMHMRPQLTCSKQPDSTTLNPDCPDCAVELPGAKTTATGAHLRPPQLSCILSVPEYLGRYLPISIPLHHIWPQG